MEGKTMDNMTNTNFKRKLPVPKEIKEMFPVSDKVAEIKNNKFNYSNGYRPKWITEFENKLKLD